MFRSAQPHNAKIPTNPVGIFVCAANYLDVLDFAVLRVPVLLVAGFDSVESDSVESVSVFGSAASAAAVLRSCAARTRSCAAFSDPSVHSGDVMTVPPSEIRIRPWRARIRYR